MLSPNDYPPCVIAVKPAELEKLASKHPHAHELCVLYVRGRLYLAPNTLAHKNHIPRKTKPPPMQILSLREFLERTGTVSLLELRLHNCMLELLESYIQAGGGPESKTVILIGPIANKKLTSYSLKAARWLARLSGLTWHIGVHYRGGSYYIGMRLGEPDKEKPYTLETVREAINRLDFDFSQHARKPAYQSWQIALYLAATRKLKRVSKHVSKQALLACLEELESNIKRRQK